MQRFDHILSPNVCTKSIKNAQTKKELVCHGTNLIRAIWKISISLIINGAIWFGIMMGLLQYTSFEFQQQIIWFFPIAQIMASLMLYSILIFPITFVWDFAKTLKMKIIGVSILIGAFILFQSAISWTDFFDNEPTFLYSFTWMFGIVICAVIVYVLKVVRTKSWKWNLKITKK